MKKAPINRQTIFWGIWILSTAGFAWLLAQGQSSFESQATLPALLVLLVCTIVLLWSLSDRVSHPLPDAARNRPILFALAVILVVLVLFPLRTLIGPPLLFGLPVLALIVLVIMRPTFSRQEIGYALLLALVAGVAGLGAGWVDFSPWAWALLQVTLVFPGLLAGWGILRKTGLWQARTGWSVYLADGLQPALRRFALGVLIATPWALGLVALGSASSEDWVLHWWQPLTAIQPGIAEEAWGRVLLVPLLFVIFQTVARPRTALTAAAVLMAFWFAYLHTPGGLQALMSTVMIGTLFALPTTYLWLRRGLETAIGFHFWLDFIKFAAAFAMNQGFWMN